MNHITVETYQKKHYTLVNILETSSETKDKILFLRNSEAVRQYMYTEHLITKEEHYNWLNMLQENLDTSLVFVVFNSINEPSGIVSITHINRTHKRADWAFYMSPDERGGIGRALEKFVLSYVFDDLKLHKLNCEVLISNQAVINLHTKFFFQKEGIRRDHCFKDNHFHDVVLMGITKNDYFKNLDKVREL